MGKIMVYPPENGGGVAWTKLGERSVTGDNISLPGFTDPSDYDMVVIRVAGRVRLTSVSSGFTPSFGLILGYNGGNIFSFSGTVGETVSFDAVTTFFRCGSSKDSVYFVMVGTTRNQPASDISRLAQMSATGTGFQINAIQEIWGGKFKFRRERV